MSSSASRNFFAREIFQRANHLHDEAAQFFFGRVELRKNFNLKAAGQANHSDKIFRLNKRAAVPLPAQTQKFARLNKLAKLVKVSAVVGKNFFKLADSFHKL